MKILVKIYSSNWETYRSHYKRATIMAFAKDNISVKEADIKHELDYIEGDTIQKQRHTSTEHSRTMRVYVNGTIKYVIGVSNTNFDEDKRIEAENGKSKYQYGVPNYHSNTYLNQGNTKIFKTYIKEKKKNNDVKLFFYLLDTKQSYCSNLSNIINYRKYATVGIDVLNIDDIDKKGWKAIDYYYQKGENIAYSSFNKFLNDLAFVSSNNKSNIPAYVKCIEEEDVDSYGNTTSKIKKYIYVFKGLGAEAYDCFLNMWTLIVLAKKENKTIEFLFAPEKYNFRLGQEHPRFTQDIPSTITNLFHILGINVEYESTDELLQQLEREKTQYENAKSKNLLRNQELFRNNMRAKGLQTKCYLCGCEVEDILEAAHLWGVSDIKNAKVRTINNAINEPGMEGIVDSDSKYSNDTFYKRYMLANSGHNGVWLCSNHHGLFDSHHFIFDSEEGKVIIKTSNTIAANYIKDTVTQKTLDKEILTTQTKTFLKYASSDEQ